MEKNDFDSKILLQVEGMCEAQVSKKKNQAYCVSENDICPIWTDDCIWMDKWRDGGINEGEKLKKKKKKKFWWCV